MLKLRMCMCVACHALVCVHTPRPWQLHTRLDNNNNTTKVVGNGRSDVIIYDSPEREDRRGNMQRFATAALRQLLSTVEQGAPASRL